MIMSTSKWAEYRAFTCDKIRNSIVCWDPYWHVLIENTLHPELYELVVKKWPDFEKINYSNNYHMFNQNRKIYNPDNPDGIEFWKKYYDNLINHKDIVEYVYSLEDLVDNCDYTTSSLWEDYRGYSVSNHYDGYTISVAWQLYVYCSGGKAWGTSLNDENGKLQKKFPFEPNTSWLMRVDANSWHSCDEVDCDVRRSVMARFMTKERS